MKKLLLLTMVLLPFSLFAEHIPPQKAQKIAERIFTSGMTPSSVGNLDLALIWDGEPFVQTAAASEPALYVFNNQSGKGFAIIAGDDKVMPVLGYSFESNVTMENLPVNLYYWIQSIRDEINYVRDNNISTTPVVQRMWSDVRTSDPVVLHETALWGQGLPYNLQCPFYDNGTETVQAVTGCVMTATAILMKFHEWPPKGIGTAPGYTSDNGVTYPERRLGTYNWDQMPLQYYTEDNVPIYTQEQADQVATLMADLGTILKALYPVKDPNETSSYTGFVPQALIDYLDYDPSVKYVYRTDYSPVEWHRLLMSELDKVPVIYSGTNKTSGHAFVLDGYTKDAYYHVNWGWNGSWNGYFLLSVLYPDSRVSNEYGYNLNQGFVMNMKKNEGQHPETPESYLSFLDYMDVFGLYLVGKDPTSIDNFQVPYTVKLGPVTPQSSNAPFVGDMILALVSPDGKIKKKYFEHTFPNGDPLLVNYNFFQGEIKCEEGYIQYGDRLMAMYRNAGDAEYHQILGDIYNGTVSEIVFNDPATSIEKNSTLEYDWTTKLLTLTFPIDVKVKLISEAGFDRNDKCEVTSGKAVVDGTKLVPGNYFFILTRGKERKEILFKI